MAEEFETVTIPELDNLTLALTSYLTGANANGKLGKFTPADFAAFIAPYITAVGGSGFVSTPGTVLPTAGAGKFTFVGGPATFTQTTGGSITTTQPLNLLGSSTTTWSLLLPIPIDLSGVANPWISRSYKQYELATIVDNGVTYIMQSTVGSNVQTPTLTATQWKVLGPKDSTAIAQRALDFIYSPSFLPITWNTGSYRSTAGTLVASAAFSYSQPITVIPGNTYFVYAAATTAMQAVTAVLADGTYVRQLAAGVNGTTGGVINNIVLYLITAPADVTNISLSVTNTSIPNVFVAAASTLMQSILGKKYPYAAKYTKDGYINTSGAVVPNSAWYNSSFEPISDGIPYQLDFKFTGIAANTANAISFYSDRTVSSFISGRVAPAGTSNISELITPPTGTKFYKLIYPQSGSASLTNTIDQYLADIKLGVLYNSQGTSSTVDSLNNLVVDGLGDSISLETGAGNTIDTVWWGRFIKWYNWSATFNAISGSKIGFNNSGDSGIISFTDPARWGALNPNSKIIFVFGGTNDFGAGAGGFTPLGSYTDARPTSVVDGTTFAAALKYLYYQLTTTYKSAKIIHMTPLARSDQRGELMARNDNPAIRLRSYVDMINLIAPDYGVMTINTFNESGLTAANMPGTAVSVDGLHPKPASHLLIAQCVNANIKDLFKA